MELGKKIVEIRNEFNLTQENFAEKYNVTRQTISSWENSKSYPDLETLVKISDDFNISLDVLLKEDKKMIKDLSKSQKDSKKYKIIKIVLVVIALIFVITNVVWFVGVKSRYMHLISGLEKIEKTKGTNYGIIKDGYNYMVKDTGYLGNSGFASVTDDQVIEATVDDDGTITTNGKIKVTLFIWPENFSGYSYGIDIDNYNNVYQINVDAKGNYLKDNNDSEEENKKQSLLDEHREEINKLFDLADKMWDIR